jgi:prenyltransferase beta subunit
VPGMEAHGGSTYCAVAALSLIQRCECVNTCKPCMCVYRRTRVRCMYAYVCAQTKCVEYKHEIRQKYTRIFTCMYAYNMYTNRRDMFDTNIKTKLVSRFCRIMAGGFQGRNTHRHAHEYLHTYMHTIYT